MVLPRSEHLNAVLLFPARDEFLFPLVTEQHKRGRAARAYQARAHLHQFGGLAFITGHRSTELVFGSPGEVHRQTEEFDLSRNFRVEIELLTRFRPIGRPYGPDDVFLLTLRHGSPP